MYKILIKTCSASNNIWNFYQEDGVDYVAASLEDMKPTALTLLKKYGKKNIKIIDQMSGQDMDNADVYIYDSTDNYEELSNRPYINGTEIVGQLTLEDLGIQPAGDYLNQNDLEEIENKINNIDLSAYATNERVDEVEVQIENIDLTPYATKEFVSEEISNIDIPETDLSEYATTKYVDDTVTNIDIPEDKPIYTISISNAHLLDNPSGITTLNEETIAELDVIVKDAAKKGYAFLMIYTYYKNQSHQMLFSSGEGNDLLDKPAYINIYGETVRGRYTTSGQLHRKYSCQLRINMTWDNDVPTVTAGYLYSGYYIPLSANNIIEFTPTSDYNPATKKYVDDAVAGAAQVNHYICTASTKNPGILNFAVTHVRPTSTRLLEIIEEGFTNIANGVNEGFVLDYSPNNNSVANWNNVVIHTNYIKPSDFTQTTSYELLAYTQRKAVIYLGVLKVNGTWSDNKFTCSSVEQPGTGAWTQFNFDLLLTKANTTEYTPRNDYNPATKKYVDDAVAGVSGGSGGGADLTNYYTKAEVDALLQELRNEFVSANNNINDKLETIIYGGE